MHHSAPLCSTLPADLVTPAAAAGLVPGRRPGKRKHVGTIYRWIARGKLRKWKLGPQTLVSAAEVLGLVTRSRGGPTEPVRAETAARSRAWTEQVLRRHGLA